MVLVLIALGGVVGLAAVVAMLEVGWRRADGPGPRACPDEAGRAEELERQVTAALLAGRLGADRYRATLAAVAHGATSPPARPPGHTR